MIDNKKDQVCDAIATELSGAKIFCSLISTTLYMQASVLDASAAKVTASASEFIGTSLNSSLGDLDGSVSHVNITGINVHNFFRNSP